MMAYMIWNWANFKVASAAGTIAAMSISVFTGIASAETNKSRAPLPIIKPASGAPALKYRAADAPSDNLTDADGRIHVGSAGFSMMPPTGWKVRDNVPGLSLVLEAQEEKSPKYRGTIQVQVAQGPRYLDSVGISDFQDEIKDKLGGEGSSLLDFTVRNSELVKADDGRDALLVYTGFNMNGAELLQAHLMISSENQHVVVTYTDLAERFDSNAADAPLGIAWAAMTSANIPGKNPERFAGAIHIGALAGLLIVFIAVLLTVRNALARKAYARVGTGAESDMNNITDMKSENLDSNPPSSLMALSSEDLLESGSPVTIEPRNAA